MDAELQGKVSEAVFDILRTADLTVVTPAMVRATVSERFSIDPLLPDLKTFVKSVVDSYFESTEVEKEDSGGSSHREEYTANGDLIIYRLTKKRLITLQRYNGTTLVSIREYFERDGKQLPTTKGISLPIDQWEALKNAIPAIESGIEKLEY
ncbi:putative transcription factor ssDNA-binding-TF family [Dioscorea sansibarensis]